MAENTKPAKPKDQVEDDDEEVRKAHEEDVKRAAKGKPSELELREADIHPSGLNARGDGPGPGHESGLNMVNLSLEDQAERRNLR